MLPRHFAGAALAAAPATMDEVDGVNLVGREARGVKKAGGGKPGLLFSIINCQLSTLFPHSHCGELLDSFVHKGRSIFFKQPLQLLNQHRFEG